MKPFRARKSPRLQGYDYSRPGAYFVTGNSVQSVECFGEIAEGVMSLSQLGVIVYEEMLRIPERWMHIRLDRCVVMPNHIHLIVIIGAGEPDGKNAAGQGLGRKMDGKNAGEENLGSHRGRQKCRPYRKRGDGNCTDAIYGVIACPTRISPQQTRTDPRQHHRSVQSGSDKECSRKGRH